MFISLIPYLFVQKPTHTPSIKQSTFILQQTKYVNDILEKFNMADSLPSGTPIDVNHGIGPDLTREKFDETLYRSKTGSLMYLTASRPEIMYVSHLTLVKMILRYLKGNPGVGLLYPRDDVFEVRAFSDSDYGSCKLNAKYTTTGCQFFGSRQGTWQCKKHTTVSLSTCEAEYAAASGYCSQVLWIQQQMRDYSLNFHTTPIFVDNTAAISITKNPVSHSKTKHIDIRNH